MNKINILSIQALKEKLYVAFMMFGLEAIDKFEVIEQMFGYYVGRFRAAYNQLNEVFLKYDVDFCTKEVQTADAERNVAFRKLRDAIKWFVTYPETEAKTQAAEKLMTVIDRYGGIRIQNQAQAAKTATITNLVEDFEEKFPTEVETLQVSSFVEALKAAQATFNEKYMARAECESEMAKGAMVEARARMDEAYRDLVDIVNLEAKQDAEGRLTGFINLMNVEISRYRTHTGQGPVGGTGGSSTEESEEAVRMRTVTFHFASGRTETIKAAIGSPIVAPQNTEGYRWDAEVPATMPEKSKTFREVPISAPGGEETGEQVTATFHFADHTEEDIRQAAGTALTAPANTTGYVWSPEVPAVMPAENTAYYELPVNPDNSEGSEDSGNQGGGGTGGGNTNPGGGYVPPSNGGGFD